MKEIGDLGGQHKRGRGNRKGVEEPLRSARFVLAPATLLRP